MKRIQWFLFFILLTTILYAQPAKKEYNSLLWRISGKGLSKPSYIYGTMHLTDKRLFNFSDSLYHSLEQTDGYAAELDMGEMMPRMISELKDEDRKTLIKDIVRSEWLLPYKKRLEKVLQKSLDKITVGDINNAKTKQYNSIIRTGEMSSIMDVYLYDIARRQGKWVGGIEDFEDQMKDDNTEDEIMSSVYGLFSDPTQMNKQIDWMIKVYLSQQLDTIDRTSQLWKGAETDILVRRNIKMARRMDSIMQLRTCLFAVGAAHIPGDSGIVTLLRGRGFKVEPVYSTKKIEPGKYTYRSKEIPWTDIPVKNEWYSMQMPGKPEQLSLDEDNESLVAQVYFDLTRMNAYFSFDFPVTKQVVNEDSLYNGMAKNFSKKGKIISAKSIAVNGTKGKEYVIKSEEGDTRIQAFIPTGKLVVNLITAYKKYDSLFGKDANRFFESFHILKTPSAPVPEAHISWKKYSFPQHAFSIKFPVNYTEQKRNPKEDTAWSTLVYTATHNASQLSCWMIVMEAKNGYYSDSDSAYFEQMKDNLLTNAKADSAELFSISSFKGFPSCDVKTKMKVGTEPFTAKLKIVNRGSRRYYFYVVYVEGKTSTEEADNFLNSFDFLPLPAMQWSYQFSPLKDISLWSPSPVQFQVDEDSSSIPGYKLYDSVSPVSLIINKVALSEYSWWDSDSAFFREQADLYLVQDNDSLIDFKIIKNGQITEADFSVIPADNHNLKKVRLLLNGDTLYSVFAFLPPDLLQGPDYSRLFNAIKITNSKAGGFHLTNKTEQILQHLALGDSARFEEASNSINSASFTPKDLPLLHKALLQPYRDFNPAGYCTHRKLVNKIIDIDDGSSFSFIRNNYALLKDSTEKLKYPFLYFLLGLKTKESFDLFKDIVTKGLPAEGKVGILEYMLTDSLELTKSIFPGILSLAADTTFIKILPTVVNSLLDSGLVKAAAIEPYKKYFYAFANKEIQRLKLEEDGYDHSANQVIKFLGYFKEPTAYTLLQQFLKLPGLFTKKEAALTLIKNDQKVDPAQLENIAKDNYLRVDLYSELEEIKKEKLFPARYYTQKLFAQSEIYQIASDDDEADSVIFIAEKTALFMGKQEKFFLFKVVYNYEGEETESFLGIAGPYPKTPGKIITASKASGLYTDEPFDSKKITTQLKEHLKQTEEYLKEDADE